MALLYTNFFKFGLLSLNIEPYQIHTNIDYKWSNALVQKDTNDPISTFVSAVSKKTSKINKKPLELCKDFAKSILQRS